MATVVTVSSGSKVVSRYSSDYYIVGSDGILKITSGGGIISGEIDRGGELLISSGGVADGSSVHVISGALMTVSSGGTASNVILSSGGRANVFSRGLTTGMTVRLGASVFVDGGTANNAIISGAVYVNTVSSGSVYYSGCANRANVYSGGVLEIRSRASAFDTGVEKGGKLLVRNGGNASSTVVSSGGTAVVENGGTASGNKLEWRGSMIVSNGGRAFANTVNSAAVMIVSSGGYASSNTVSSGNLDVYGSAVENKLLRCSTTVYSGGTATSNTVSTGVTFGVAGSALSSVIYDSGAMIVSSGGYASATSLYAGGELRIKSKGLASGTVMSGGSMVINGSSYYGSYHAGSLVIDSGGYSYRETFNNKITYINGNSTSGGFVLEGTLGSGNSAILSGGSFRGATVSNAFFDIRSGYADVSSVNGATVNLSGGYFYASGGSMSSATVRACGSTTGMMFVCSGASVNYINMASNTSLRISNGAVVSSAYASASVASGASVTVEGGGRLNYANVSGSLMISSGGIVNYAMLGGGALAIRGGGVLSSALIQSGAAATVFGSISSATVGSGSPLQISSGGVVSSATVSSGGRIGLNGGTLSRAYFYSGTVLNVNSGGKAYSARTNGSTLVDYGGVVSGLSIGAGGLLYVSSTGIARATNLFGGSAYVYSGGSLMNCTAEDSGSVTLYNGAIALSCTVGFDGVAKISSGAVYNNLKVLNGGKVTGIYDCYGITFSSGAIADFNIFNLGGGNTNAVVSNLYYAKNKGAVFTLTVSASQAKGTYKLADNASGFNETITVKNIYGDTFGTLKVGQITDINGVNYKLDLDGDNNLTVTVGAAAPVPTSKDFFSGDFNGGGCDMLAKRKDNAVTVYYNGEPWGLGVALDPGWDVVASGDFNADKKDDFLRVNTEGYVVGEMSNGNGTFTPQVLNLKNAGWNILGTGDFNHNGTDDVLIANPTGASSTVGLLGYWESGVTWTLINGYSPEWECVSTGDFNGDGKCDMLWRNSFVGDGGLTYNAYCTWIVDNPVDWRMVSVANPTEWNFLCSGDFDGNGSHDIAMINGEGVVGIWGVNDGYLNSWSILSAVDASAWELAGVGDFNGDKTDDIAWRNMSTGLTGYWQINGKTLTGWQNIATIS